MSARGRRLAPWGVAALALVLTACGGGSKSASKSTIPAGQGSSASSAAGSATTAAATATGGSGPFDFCRLITQAEAQDAVGKPLAAGVSTSGQSVPGHLAGGCKYLSATFNPQTSRKSLVQAIYLGKMTRSQFDQVTTGPGKIETKPVSGLGEVALYAPGLLTWFDQGIALTIQVVRDDGSSPDVAVLTGLAHKVTDRAGDLR
ncbi:MAG: hypothetical protein ABJB98_01015 [Actinomycetota bacterium]